MRIIDWILVVCVLLLPVSAPASNSPKAPKKNSPSASNIPAEATRQVMEWYLYFVDSHENDRVRRLPFVLPDAPLNALLSLEDLRCRGGLSSSQRQELDEFIKRELIDFSNAKRDNETLAAFNDKLTIYTAQAESRLLFINQEHTRDISTANAEREKALFVIGGDVMALVNFPAFKQATNIRLPPSMSEMIQAEYINLAHRFSAPAGTDLSSFSLSLLPSTSEGTWKLWMETSVQRKKIAISPVLVRAIFMQAINNSADWMFTAQKLMRVLPVDRRALQTGLPDGERPSSLRRILLDGGVAADVLLKQFREELHFIIAHEIAHIVLGKNGVLSTDERACDDLAYQIVTELDGRVSLDAFRTLLVQAAQHGLTDMWGIETGNDAEDLNQRLVRMIQKTELQNPKSQ